MLRKNSATRSDSFFRDFDFFVSSSREERAYREHKKIPKFDLL